MAYIEMDFASGGSVSPFTYEGFVQNGVTGSFNVTCSTKPRYVIMTVAWSGDNYKEAMSIYNVETGECVGNYYGNVNFVTDNKISKVSDTTYTITHGSRSAGNVIGAFLI